MPEYVSLQVSTCTRAMQLASSMEAIRIEKSIFILVESWEPYCYAINLSTHSDLQAKNYTIATSEVAINFCWFEKVLNRPFTRQSSAVVHISDLEMEQLTYLEFVVWVLLAITADLSGCVPKSIVGCPLIKNWDKRVSRIERSSHNHDCKSWDRRLTFQHRIFQSLVSRLSVEETYRFLTVSSKPEKHQFRTLDEPKIWCTLVLSQCLVPPAAHGFREDQQCLRRPGDARRNSRFALLLAFLCSRCSLAGIKEALSEMKKLNKPSPLRWRVKPQRRGHFMSRGLIKHHLWNLWSEGHLKFCR